LGEAEAVGMLASALTETREAPARPDNGRRAGWREGRGVWFLRGIAKPKSKLPIKAPLRLERNRLSGGI